MVDKISVAFYKKTIIHNKKSAIVYLDSAIKYSMKAKKLIRSGSLNQAKYIAKQSSDKAHEAYSYISDALIQIASLVALRRWKKTEKKKK